MTSATAVQTYNGPDIGQPVVNNANNNIYIRCKNISGATMTGNANLYYANSSLFLYPTSWIPVNLPVTNNNFVTTSGTVSTSLPNAMIGLVQSPFTLGGIPNNAHYCFIAVVNNNGVPTTIPPSFASNAAFALWVSSSPNVAYRNIVLNAGSPGRVVNYTTFGNANSFASQMIFSVVGTNVPANSTWSAQCSDARLPQPFNASGTFSSSGTASTQLTVPANIAGGNPLMSMAWTFATPNGQPFPTNTSFAISYYQVPTSPGAVEGLDDAFFALEAQASAEYKIASRDPEAVNGVEAATLILLGSVLVFATNPHS
ncbi:hypothetical protein OF829_00435 [Sphingomonas sp. LB-2]|uniref:hypothetical protein n=1 Tax=Sphingomonas caeni TaxID=2984949 RepID=UPI002232B5C5|nr:hypothetical protein [Sphingomonas caeni]MCW3845688.1 hypothetical protein [Sphingomonas caeni]